MKLIDKVLEGKRVDICPHCEHRMETGDGVPLIICLASRIPTGGIIDDYVKVVRTPDIELCTLEDYKRCPLYKGVE